MATPAPAPEDVLDHALAAIARYDRPDLQARLRQSKARIANEHIRVLVVGEFKQGKSMLVNGLVRAPVCPAYDDLATSVPTVVRYAPEPEAAMVRLIAGDDADPDAPEDGPSRRAERVPISIDDLASYVAESGNPDNQQGWHHVEIGLPRGVLIGGLELVDTPGVGGLSSVHGAATMAALASADAVLMVSDASSEYTRPELDFLRQAKKVCPNVACVLTKTDLYPEWRRIYELNRGHLAAAGIDAELLAVSAVLRVHAIRTGAEEADAESGYPVLIDYLRQRVVGQADLLSRRSTVHDVLNVTEQLAAALRAESKAHSDPDAAAGVVKELTEAQRTFEALKERSARWQQTLNDGVADLNADIDYDLRDRMREIVREAEDAINHGGDPRKIWPQLAEWIEQESSAACSANYLWTTQRARWLATLVAEHFAEEGNELLPKLRTESEDALGSVREMTLREIESFGIGQKMLSGMRGGYVGVLMFGMLGTIVGMPLINPFSIGAGMLLGGKGVTDERRRVFTRRQAEAKTTVRRYIDDVIFQVGKESKDMLRRVQRDLRDHFTTRAEEMNRSLKDSVKAAERSVNASNEERKTRLAEIPRELAALEKMQDDARALLPTQERADEPVAALR